MGGGEGRFLSVAQAGARHSFGGVRPRFALLRVVR